MVEVAHTLTQTVENALRATFRSNRKPVESAD